MAQLKVMHGGWERERLAEYLLSRFSFVANPAKVGDDVGADFFCTIFEPKTINEQSMLAPRGSFAIQVKSSDQKIPIGDNIDYFKRLELPFFIGVVNQSPSNHSMEVYSAEFLPVFLIHHDLTNIKLSLNPVPHFDATPENYFSKTRTGQHSIKCPLVATFSVKDDEQTVRTGADKLDAVSARTRKHLVARFSEEHIYEFPSGPRIFAGSGSAKHFRCNFYDRLAEAYANLKWLLEDHGTEQNPDDETLATELKFYLSLYDKLQALDPNFPPNHVERVYKKLKRAAEGIAN